MNKILVVEDEMSIRSFVSLSLRKKGYEITEAESGEEALDHLQNQRYDIVLLDLMLPGINGFEVCQEIRRKNQKVGIIMLTARTQEQDKVEGLVLGADDYIFKPFSIKELEARIFSLLRRLNAAGSIKDESKALLSSGPFQLDTKNKQFFKKSVEVNLTPTEYSILHFFMEHPNELFSRDELLDEIWGKNYVGELKVVDVNIRRIRRKIEEDPSSPVYLCTVWGHGYTWKE